MHHEFATYIRPYRGFAMAPTHDGLTMIVGGWPHAELDRVKDDLETHFYEILDLVPEVAERVRDAKREAPFAGVPTTNYFRKPFGPGWALLGDAGYLKDPITAQGISDAFRDAEQFAAAFDEFSGGDRSYGDAMQDFQRMTGRVRAADVRNDLRPRHARTAATGYIDAIRRTPRQPDRGRFVRADECRYDLTGTVLLARKRPIHHGRAAVG